MSELITKVALVTGGTSGIGLGAVESLLAHGASVALCGIDPDQTGEVEQRLKSGYGESRVLAVTADVTSESAMRSFADSAARHFGGLDIAVTAAGIQTYGSAADIDLDLWNRTLAVNLTGSYLAVKAALPHIRLRRGAVVLVSSVQAFVSQSSVSAYSASKGALNAFVRALAIDEAPHGVRANAVCPASVDTPMLRASARQFSDGTDAGEQAVVEQWGAMHPVGRVARPSEIGEVIAFLASDRASFVTGISMPVDGGLLSSVAVAIQD
ncbi:SDR family NAD(P)-dependent oxidoreductase [Rhodococcus sp. NPDC055112]